MVVRLATPGQVIQVNPGDTIRVQVAFTYQGPAWRETLYSALYINTPIPHNEISGGAGALGWDIPKCDTPVSITNLYVDVPVPNRPGETVGIYAKLGNILSSYYDSVIQILGVAAPIVTTFRITSYTKV